ncbi:MAG: hypothetical protein L6W00_05930 [Lentisphaeria bacterium]|nr:MAG: hypothetical protein L6W00_05930 [Lentisphaeria bacterium]
MTPRSDRSSRKSRMRQSCPTIPGSSRSTWNQSIRKSRSAPRAARNPAKESPFRTGRSSPSSQR